MKNEKIPFFFLRGGGENNIQIIIWLNSSSGKAIAIVTLKKKG
jgi:hypothetical protein